MKSKCFLLLFSLAIICLCCASSVSAISVDDSFDSLNTSSEVFISSSDIEVDSYGLNSTVFENNDNYKNSNNFINSLSISNDSKSPKTYKNNSQVVNSNNFEDYFENNCLKQEYAGSTLIFDGEFSNMGVITINQEGTSIVGNNTLFNNTVVSIKAANVTLANINFILDKVYSENNNSGILIDASDVTIFNIFMNCTLKEDVTGYGIYSKGDQENYLERVRLLNNTIYFEGNCINTGYNYGIIITYTYDAVVSKNNISCRLPLRAVNWNGGIFGGLSMDTVAGVAVGYSENFVLSNNYIYVNVSGSKQSYPTLDACIIYKCDNSTITKNTIIEEDFFTKNGTDNYLYALDIYILNDVTITYNNISVNTTGGKVAAGTAYPIQVSGPAYNIKIAYNNISTYSNGPNIGIYSQNYYGSTQIDIISNNITVFGVSSTHSWALVAGIEVQDSSDRILNNTIRVTNVGNVSKPGNLYGISYSQSTTGDHTYDIQFNDVETNGNYAVLLKGGADSSVINSIISNNRLVAKYEGSRSVSISGGINNTIKNNTGSGGEKVDMPLSSIPPWLGNSNNEDYSSYILSLKKWIDDVLNPVFNDPGKKPSKTNNNTLPQNNGNQENNANNPNVFNSTNSVLRDNATSLKSSSPGQSSNGLDGAIDSGSTDSDSFELNSVISKTFDVLKIAIVLLAILLFVVGFRRNRKNK